jgi:hypothetical protein
LVVVVGFLNTSVCSCFLVDEAFKTIPAYASSLERLDRDLFQELLWKFKFFTPALRGVRICCQGALVGFTA